MKKKQLLLVSLLLYYITAHTQIHLNLHIDDAYNPAVFEWTDRSDLTVVIVRKNNVDLQKLTLGTKTFLADKAIPYNANIEEHKKKLTLLTLN